ncbi:MAG: hypothetical protein ACOCXM_11775 [Myxococcota bacterium]
MRDPAPEGDDARWGEAAMIDCEIVGPRLATAGDAVRLDVVVRGAPARTRLHIRLDRSWPGPPAPVDAWSTRGRGGSTITSSFLWRAGPCGVDEPHCPVVLKATIRCRGVSCVRTHGVEVLPFDPEVPAPSVVAEDDPCSSRDLQRLALLRRP